MMGQFKGVFRFDGKDWNSVRYLTIYQASQLTGISVTQFAWVAKELKIDANKFNLQQVQQVQQWHERMVTSKKVRIHHYNPEMLKALAWELRYKLGRPIKYRDWKEQKGYPMIGTLINHFGSWNDFLVAARLKVSRYRTKKNRTQTILK